MGNGDAAPGVSSGLRSGGLGGGRSPWLAPASPESLLLRAVDL